MGRRVGAASVRVIAGDDAPQCILLGRHSPGRRHARDVVTPPFRQRHRCAFSACIKRPPALRHKFVRGLPCPVTVALFLLRLLCLAIFFARSARGEVATVRDRNPWWFDLQSRISETRKVQSFGRVTPCFNQITNKFKAIQHDIPIISQKNAHVHSK